MSEATKGVNVSEDIRLVGALMLEQNDEWAVSRRYMTLEIVTEVCKPEDIEPLPLAAE